MATEQQKQMVQDLTAFFNAVVTDEMREEGKPAFINAYGDSEASYGVTLHRIYGQLARIVDFHAGTRITGSAVQYNYLHSAELSAIDMMYAVTSGDTADTAVKTLYRAMADTAKARNLAFTPAYRP